MSDSKNIEKMVLRFRVIWSISLLIGIVIIGRIIYIQYFMKDCVVEADFYQIQIMQPNRGSILSYDGRPLATSMPYYKIRMDCTSPHDTLFENNLDDLCSGLSSIFENKSASAYKKEISSARKNGKRYFAIGNRGVDYNELQRIKQLPIFDKGKFKGGLIVEQINRRSNPYGRLAFRTVGYINADGQGVGIERSYDYKLKGSPGERTLSRIAGNQWIPVNGEKTIQAIDGYDIQTTIDIDIQEAAETALRSQLAKSDVLEGGTAIVMSVKTGAVRAIANMKKMPGGTFDESYNYAIHEATEPGSTLKLATLISLIEDGYVTLNSPIDAGNGVWMYSGTKFSDTHAGGYGLLTVKQAFEKSSNIAFAKLIVDHYGDDESGYVARFHNLKINENLNLDIEGEGRAQVFSPEDRYWSKVSLPMMGIGYGVLLTPMHTLTFYNAIANDGKMMRPYFVDNFQRNGKKEEVFQPQQVSGSICSKSTIKEVKKALRGVVENGTAAKYNDKRYQIAGKTGTAQIAFDNKYVDSQGYRKHQASFAGFFPADNPQYSCIVVLYSGKTRSNFYGGSWATPVFKQISDKIYASHPEWSEPISGSDVIAIDNPDIANGRAKEAAFLVDRLPMKESPRIPEKGWISISENGDQLAASAITLEDHIVPEVKGMGLKDALYILENEGFTVSFKGKGRVKSQSPSAGESFRKGEKIEIILSE